MERLPEYLAGLRCNQRAAKRWFPGWSLRLYISKLKAEGEPELWSFIDEIAKFNDPPIEVYECDPNFHPTLERYRPFCDPTVALCIARDVDSILTKTDADIVNQWISDDRYDVLQYREYMMNDDGIMGGGIGLKRSCFKLGCPTEIVKKEVTRFQSGELKGKGFDESSLAKFLKAYTDRPRWKSYITRMTEVGDYYLLPSADTDSLKLEPRDMVLLWTTPFFDIPKGFAYCQPGFEWLENANIARIVDYIKNVFTIRPEHTGSHWPQHSGKITMGKKWTR